MAQTSIHPDWYPNAKVYCDGQLILKVGSTKPRLNVDIWSGNHPFYTGSQKIIDTEGRVERFMRKYNIKNQNETQDQDYYHQIVQRIDLFLIRRLL